MHKIHAKKFTLDDFSYEHLVEEEEDFDIKVWWGTDADNGIEPKDLLELTIDGLNEYRNAYLETKDKKYWWQMIQLLPSSYNQKRTVMLNYEVLNNIYTSRRKHKLDEWRDFCDWAKTLPHSKLITGISDVTDDFWKVTRTCFAPMTEEEIARAILVGDPTPEERVIYKDALSKE